MDKLTLLTFEQLFDQMSYDDCEKFTKDQFKKQLETKIFNYHDQEDNISYLIQAINKRDAIRKLFELDIDNKYFHCYTNDYIGNFKCIVCDTVVIWYPYEKILSLKEHIDTHDIETIIDKLIDDKKIFMESKLI